MIASLLNIKNAVGKPHSPHVSAFISAPLTASPTPRQPLLGCGPGIPQVRLSPTHQEPVTRRASPSGPHLLSGLLEMHVPTPDSASANLLAGPAELTEALLEFLVPSVGQGGVKDTGEWGEKPGGRSPGSGVPGFCPLELGCHVWSPSWTPSEPHAVGAFWRFCQRHT